MPRAAKIMATLVAVGAGFCVAAAAAGAAGSGTLSAAEYQQLSAVSAALNLSASSKSINWTRARAACARAGRATALLRTQGLSCLDSLGELEALTNFPAEQRHCASTTKKTAGSRTTTGTTTGATGASSVAIRLMICMNSRYQALARDARTAYTADTAARKQALLRGFGGTCLATLAASPAHLRAEGRFATASVKLAADVTLLTRIIGGKAPTGDFSQPRIDADVKQFETSAAAGLDKPSEQQLASCPHA